MSGMASVDTAMPEPAWPRRRRPAVPTRAPTACPNLAFARFIRTVVRTLKCHYLIGDTTMTVWPTGVVGGPWSPPIRRVEPACFRHRQGSLSSGSQDMAEAPALLDGKPWHKKCEPNLPAPVWRSLSPFGRQTRFWPGSRTKQSSLALACISSGEPYAASACLGSSSVTLRLALATSMPSIAWAHAHATMFARGQREISSGSVDVGVGLRLGFRVLDLEAVPVLAVGPWLRFQIVRRCMSASSSMRIVKCARCSRPFRLPWHAVCGWTYWCLAVFNLNSRP